MRDFEKRMQGAVEVFKTELSGIRAGQAHVGLLEHLEIQSYGAKMKLSQMASLAAPQPQLLTVQVWDENNIENVEKSLLKSHLGLTPQRDGNIIRLNVPPLSQQRRKEMAKLVAQYAESTRVAVRNVRRSALDNIKTQTPSQDELHRLKKQLNKLTEEKIAQIHELATAKEQDILKPS